VGVLGETGDAEGGGIKHRHGPMAGGRDLDAGGSLGAKTWELVTDIEG